MLPALVFLLPFEPRRPVLAIVGLQVTLLEAAAGALALALVWTARRRIAPLLRRPPLPLAFLALYAAAHVLSAAFAPAHRDLACRFALRMVVMAGLGLAAAAAAPEAGRRALVALVATAAVVALLSIAEGAGVRAIDPLLDRFREMPFNIGGSRRASGGSEYPNLAAAFLMAGLLAAAGLAASWRRPAWSLLPLAALFAVGLLFTYSRGALVATAFGLAALAAAGRARRFAAPALCGLAVLLASSAAFAWTGQVYRLRLEAEGPDAWYGVTYAPGERSLALRPGEVRATDVTVTNTGRMTWTSSDDVFHLAYHWYDADRRKLEDGRRTLLPRAIGPGETVTLRAELQAPLREGRYLLGWDMVQERVTWFSDRGLSPALVPVVVSATAPAVAPPAAGIQPPEMETAPPAWRPGRGELWSLALALWRQRPLLGVGPDNFRWLYGRAAGQPSWDTRVFANNALLEAAATTGALGLVALAGTLATTALRAGRFLRDPGRVASTAGALFAVTLGLAAHGLVDYVLAFTGHYLLLGFVVGGAAGLGQPEAAA